MHPEGGGQEWRASEAQMDVLRRRIDEYLRSTIEKAEGDLKRLHRSPAAWQLIRVQLTDTMPSFGTNPLLTDRLLGPMAPRRVTSLTPSATIPAVAKIRRHAARCRKCLERTTKVDESLRDHSRIAGVRECRPDLFKQYQKELRRAHLPRMVDWGPSWRAACMAAVAYAALNTSDPDALFAAARFLEQQEIIVHLLRNLPREERAAASRALRRYEDVARQRQRRGGLAKRGKLRPHWQLIRRCLVYDESMAERLEPWIHNAPRERGREDVLRMLADEDLVQDLFSGGPGGDRLPLLGVTVDRDGSAIEVEAADGKTSLVSFRELSRKIGRLKNA